jgi:hypothetical protein
MDKFAKACTIIAAVTILGFAGNAVAESSNPATQDLKRKGFNPQPEPPEKGTETMRKPDPTLNTQKLNTLKNNPKMKSVDR